MALKAIPQVVTIAGSDSSGGAGLNADTRVWALKGVYGATIVTGITAQNTRGVHAVQPVSASLLRQQLHDVFNDLDIQVMKTGALFTAEIVSTLADFLATQRQIPLVIDPVMIAKGGARLLSPEAITKLKDDLLPMAFLVTPNIAEAELLANMPIVGADDMVLAAERIQELGAKNVLIKGGHLNSRQISDVLLAENGDTYWYEKARIDTIRTHGTGDTLSAYIVAELAKKRSLLDIMPAAEAYMLEVIKQGIDVGAGHGPLNHWADIRSADK